MSASSPSGARARVLARLRDADVAPVPVPDVSAYYRGRSGGRDSDPAARVERLCARLTAARAEVLRSTPDGWVADLVAALARRSVGSVALSRAQAAGAELAQGLALGLGEALPVAIRAIEFAGPLEAWKREAFESVDAGFVDARAGIADIGVLVLEHGAGCPRALSLIPPVSVLRVLASRLFDTMHAAVTEDAWHACATSNRVLVSSPTRTADIQQVLAYGAHGPCELVVCVVDDLATGGRA